MIDQKHGPVRFRWYLFLLAFLILPNLPLLLAAHPLTLLLPGFIDLDYLFIGILSLFVPRAVTFLLLLVAILLDFIRAACITYLFSPSEFLNTMRYGGMLATTRIELIVAAFGLVLLVCLVSVLWTSPRLDSRRRGLAAAILAVPLVLLAGLHFVSPAFSRAPTLGLLRSQLQYDRSERGLRLGGQYAMPSATALALHHLEDYRPHLAATGPAAAPDTQPNFVLIIVESWGLARDLALRQSMAEPYSRADLNARYNVLQGTMPFQGPTTSGEGRELCQSHLGSFVTQGTPAQAQRCLPWRLRRMGYTTLAVHGFLGEMYLRESWYPKIGFEQFLSHKYFHPLGMPDCDGPFTGTCDAYVAGWLGDRLQEPSAAPRFMYWVTLNSHLPVPIPSKAPSPANCAVSAITAKDPAVCSWYQLISVVSRSVHDLALRPLNRPTIFVIIGDHAPPFSVEAERTAFSSTEVPYVILLPKTQ